MQNPYKTQLKHKGVAYYLVATIITIILNIINAFDFYFYCHQHMSITPQHTSHTTDVAYRKYLIWSNLQTWALKQKEYGIFESK